MNISWPEQHVFSSTSKCGDKVFIERRDAGSKSANNGYSVTEEIYLLIFRSAGKHS